MTAAAYLEQDARHECVLVVGDEPAVRRRIEGILTSAGKAAELLEKVPADSRLVA